MKKNRISRTSSLRCNLKTNAKHVFGRHVRIGDIYADCHVKCGHVDSAAYMAVQFDPEKRLLMIKELDTEKYVVLGGDMVAWHGELYADKVHATFYLPEPILETLENYREKKNLERLSDEDIQVAMRERYPKFGIGNGIGEMLLSYEFGNEKCRSE